MDTSSSPVHVSLCLATDLVELDTFFYISFSDHQTLRSSLLFNGQGLVSEGGGDVDDGKSVAQLLFYDGQCGN